MIRPPHFREDERVLEDGLERLRDTEVIDTPPDVPRATIVHIEPPGVVVRVFVEDSEGVDEARVEDQ